MGQFNIHNSKIDQLSNSGNNYKVTDNPGNVAISGQGNVVQTPGSDNEIQVGEPKKGLLATLWKCASIAVKWIKGIFVGA